MYDVSTQASFYNTAGGLAIQVQKSGESTWETASLSYNDQPGWHNWTSRKVLSLNAGDKVRVTSPTNSGEILPYNSAYSQFNIVEILGANQS